MKNVIVASVALLLTAAASALASWFVFTSQLDDAVYVIGSVSITDPSRLAEYQAKAQPMAHSQGGYAPLGFSKPRLIEGQLPAEGLFFVERFASRKALDNFLDSDAFQDLKPLRDKVADVHFMLAIDAYSKRGEN